METNENENTKLKIFGTQQRWFQERCLQQYRPISRNKKISNKQLNLTPKGARKRITKPKTSRRKETTRLEKKNDIETKTNKQNRSMKQGAGSSKIINKIDKLLARLINNNKKVERSQENKNI